MKTNNQPSYSYDKEGKVTSITGKDIDIKADSVCVHGDGEKHYYLWRRSVRHSLRMR